MGRLESPYFDGTHIPKPRQKAAREGISSLSDAELVALLLDTGSRKENVVDLASRMLDEKGGLRGVFLGDVPLQTFGVKSAKEFRLLAVREIVRRIPLLAKDPVLTPEEAFQRCRMLFYGKRREIAVCLFLSRDKQLLMKKEYTSEAYSSVFIPFSRITKDGLLCSATFVLFLHNHPSGHLSFSNADLAFAGNLERTLNSLEMSLLDFLVVGDDSFVSLRASQIKSQTKS